MDLEPQEREGKAKEGIQATPPQSHTWRFLPPFHPSLWLYPLDQCSDLFVFHNEGELHSLITHSRVLGEKGKEKNNPEKQKPATEICMVLNYTLVNITWQSVHINLIGF